MAIFRELPAHCSMSGSKFAERRASAARLIRKSDTAACAAFGSPTRSFQGTRLPIKKPVKFPAARMKVAGELIDTIPHCRWQNQDRLIFVVAESRHGDGGHKIARRRNRQTRTAEQHEAVCLYAS